jgi:hypothetical protein
MSHRAITEHEIMEAWRGAKPETRKIAIEMLREADRMKQAGASDDDVARFCKAVADRHHGKAVSA